MVVAFWWGTNEKSAKNIRAAGDLVIHDAQGRLKLVVVAAQFIEGDNGIVAGAICVVHGGPIDRAAIFHDGKIVGDRERFAVPDDHALDVIVGHP